MKRSTNTAPVSLSTSYLIGSPCIGISMTTLQSFGTSAPAGTRSRLIDVPPRNGGIIPAVAAHIDAGSGACADGCGPRERRRDAGTADSGGAGAVFAHAPGRRARALGADHDSVRQAGHALRSRRR